jgi:hypothetical protein
MADQRPSVEEAIRLLEDPTVPESVKLATVEYLRDLRSRPERLAAALHLDHVPTLTAEQERALTAAEARAEAAADRIYGDRTGRAAA